MCRLLCCRTGADEKVTITIAAMPGTGFARRSLMRAGTDQSRGVKQDRRKAGVA
jgi:hypothetical protein